MKHTKGKWAWQRFGDHYHLTAQHGMREIIISANIAPQHSLKPYVSMNVDGILRSVNPDNPNAKLIAKCPEMLEALKAVRLHVGMIEHNWDWREKEFMPKIIQLINDIEK